MSNEINTNLKFNVNSKQLQQATAQLKRLTASMRMAKKSGDATSASFRKKADMAALLKVKISQLEGTFGRVSKSINKSRINTERLNKEIKKSNDNFKKNEKAVKKTDGVTKKFGETAKRVGKKVKEGNKALGDTDKTSKKAGSSLGFTGLAFGFIGGAAAFAGNQIKTEFIQIVQDGIEDIGAMNRAIVQSGIDLEGFLGGNLNEFAEVGDKIKDLQQIFGEFSRAEVASAFEQIGRAVGEDVGIDDVEKITKGLLTIARIDKTGGAGLAKTAVDLKRSMTQFGIGGDELDSFLDKMVNTNQQGAIELNQLVSSLGFAGAQAQRFGVDLDETLALTGFIFEKSGRKAGAAGRTFGNILDQLASTAVATNPVIQGLGIDILDTAGNFNTFSDIVDQARIVFAKMKAEGKGQIFESALLEEFGFDKTAARGFLSLVQTSRAELDALINEVGKEGSADLLSEAIGQGADIKIKAFENELRNLKAEFATGFAPALSDFTNMIREFSQDDEFVATIQAFGKAVAGDLTTGLRLVVDILKPFVGLLKENQPLIAFLSKSIIGLVGAFSAMGIIFPLLGGLFAMQFLHEKLILRFNQLGNQATFVTQAYGRMNNALEPVRSGLKSFMSGLKSAIGGTARFAHTLITDPSRAFQIFKLQMKLWKVQLKIFRETMIETSGKIRTKFVDSIKKHVIPALKNWGNIMKRLFQPFTTLMSAVVNRFVGWGASAAIFFAGAFNTVTNALIAAGGFVSRLLTRLGGAFLTVGTVVGSMFAGAFSAAASAIATVGGWITTAITRIAIAFGFGGGVSGIGWGAAFGLGAETGATKPGWMARAGAKIGAAFAFIGGAVGSAFSGAFTIVSSALMSAGTWLKSVFVKLAGFFGIGGGAAGTTFGAGFQVTSTATTGKPGFLARLFAPFMVKSGIAGAASGTIFGTAFMVAAVAAIVAGAAILIDVLGEILTGQSLFKGIEGHLGVKPQDQKSSLDILKDFTGFDVKSGLDVGSAQGGLLGGGIRDRNPADGGDFFSSVSAKGRSGSTGETKIINSDVVVNPTINFSGGDNLDEEAISKKINEELARFFEPKLGNLYR